jgi:hypothetical protein
MKNPGAERAQTLLTELTQLHELQLEALKQAAFIPMSPAERKVYDGRLSRIRQISELLSHP